MALTLPFLAMNKFEGVRAHQLLDPQKRMGGMHSYENNIQ